MNAFVLPFNGDNENDILARETVKVNKGESEKCAMCWSEKKREKEKRKRNTYITWSQLPFFPTQLAIQCVVVIYKLNKKISTFTVVGVRQSL